MYRFKVFGLKSQEFVGEVPFTIEGDLTRVLQGFGAGSLALNVLEDEVPSDWDQMVLPWRNVILAVDEDDNILWPGIPNDRIPASAVTMSYPCVTVEGYFLRRHVSTRAYVQQDQADIAQNLASICGDAAGIPLEYDCPKTGVVRNQTYADDEDGKVYNRLQELATMEDGFNWTIDVEWANEDHSRIKYVFRTGYPHLGYRTATPEHVFEMPGNISDFDGSESWGDGDAATHVQGSGDGDGDTKLTSVPVVDTVREAAGWPRLEERRQFSGVNERQTLDAHVRAMAAELFGGQNVVTITVRDGAGTSLADLTLGDSARVLIDAPTKKVDEVSVVVGLSLMPNSSEFKPTLARLGGSLDA